VGEKSQSAASFASTFAKATADKKASTFAMPTVDRPAARVPLAVGRECANAGEPLARARQTLGGECGNGERKRKYQ